MIAKLIRMNRGERRASVRRLGNAINALTRYIADVDPHRLVQLRAGQILSLGDYALAIEGLGAAPGEKVAAFGARNLIGGDLIAWQAQMLATAARNNRIANPMLHIVLSLDADEDWTVPQREDAIDVVTRTLGLGRSQLIWAEHNNTPNAHIHLAVMRVDPQTGGALGSDWLIDDLHQAVALLDERQGRTRAPGALYIARAGAVHDPDTGALVRDAAGCYQPGWYKDAGVKRERLPSSLKQNAGELLDAALGSRSWAELHAAFRKLSAATYDKKGSGALISVAGDTAIASEVHASLSLPRLVKRLGPFEPDLARQDPRYEAYRSAFDAQLSGLREQRAAECGGLDAWSEKLLASLGSVTARMLKPAVERERKAARDAIDTAFRAAIRDCTKARLSNEQWRAAGSPPLPPPVSSPALILPSLSQSAEAAVAWYPDLTPTHRAWQTDYRDRAGSLLLSDHRVVIVAHQSQPQTIDAALRLGAARWGAVRIFGSEAFVSKAVARASELGIRVVDADGHPIETQAPVIRSTPQAYAETLEGPKEMSTQAPPRNEGSNLELEAIARLARGHLPLRRRPDRTLEVVIDGDARFDVINPDLKHAALLNRDPAVQRILEDSRAATLRELEKQLRPSSHRTIEPEEPVWRVLDRDDMPLVRAAALATADPAFEEMMTRVRALWSAREEAAKVRDRQRRSRIARAVADVRNRGLLKPTDLERIDPMLRSGRLHLQKVADGIRIRSVDRSLAEYLVRLAQTPVGAAALKTLAQAAPDDPADGIKFRIDVRADVSRMGMRDSDEALEQGGWTLPRGFERGL